MGVQSWLKMGQRTNCVSYISAVQTSMRSYQNAQQLDIGNALTSTSFIGSGLLLETGSCPSGGTYTYATTVPAIGTAYVTCSQSSATFMPHVPKVTTGW